MSGQMIMLVALTLAPSAAASGFNVGSIITLLKNLESQAIEEGKNEQAAFAKFSYWCKTSTSGLKSAIGEEDAAIDQLNSAAKGFMQTQITLDGDASKIAALNADLTINAQHRKDWVEEVDGDISDLATEESDFTAAATAASTKNTNRMTAYTTKSTNLATTLTAVKDALAKMQTAGETDSGLLDAKKDVSQVLALLSPAAEEAPAALAVPAAEEAPAAEASAADVKAKGDKKAAVKKYASKSSSVIELLKGLAHKFEDDVAAAIAEETASANAYVLEKAARAAALAAVSKSKTQKEGTSSETAASLSETNGNLDNEKDDRTADKATLDTTDTQCKTRTREWEERSTTRSREIQAISMAVKILAKVSGVRTEAPNNPALGASPVSFLQVVDPQTKVVNLLHATAKTTHSKALERLAMEISARSKGSFSTVNDAIQKMVFQLMKDQTEDDKHKSWCDIEISKTSKSKEDKTDKLAALNAKIDANTASVSLLTNQITEADQMVADITSYMAESTEIRAIGKKENKLALKDAEKAETALANAVAVLEEHYKSSGMVAKESYEFVQTSSSAQQPVELPADPALWDSSYTGVSDPTKAGEGVLAILLTVASDFSQMEAETKAQEATDQKQYDTEMAAHKVEKTRRQQESAVKQTEKKRKISKGAAMAGQVKHLTGELAAVESYEKDLQAPCVAGDSTYADKKAARKQEIDALKLSQTTLRDAFKTNTKFLEVKAHA